MTAEHILDAIGLLDDDLILEAEGYAAPKARSWRRWTALAASFAVVILLGYGAVRLGVIGGGSKGMSGAGMNGGTDRPSGSVFDEADGPLFEPAGGAEEPPQGNGVGSVQPGDWGLAGGNDAVQSPEGEGRPAIMVEGVLYWSTGVPLSGEVDEGAVRTVTSYTSALPEMDGQTNFSQDLSARYAWTVQGLAVQVEGEWILFSPEPPPEG